MPAWKNALLNTATVLVSLALTYLVGSFLVFRLLLPHLSFNVRPHFPDLPEVMVQNTKAGYVPKDYIAILGDSYAAGLGDWLLEVKGNRGAVFHSAHVLHELTGRDVVSLGRPGAGSAQALVAMPARVLRAGRCFVFPPIDAPKNILIYFYEGNDYYDNAQFADQALKESAGDSRAAIGRYVEERYGTARAWRCYGYLAEAMYAMTRYAVLGARELRIRSLSWPSAHNRVIVDGTPTPVSMLQEPPVAIDAGRIELAVTVFNVSLAWLRRHFPDSDLTLVYLPSPAAVYRHATETVETLSGIFPVKEIYIQSQKSCETIRQISLAHGVRFIDVRPVIRAVAAKQLVHGPLDWLHFNKAGYRTLGVELAQSIGNREDTPCRDWD